MRSEPLPARQCGIVVAIVTPKQPTMMIVRGADVVANAHRKKSLHRRVDRKDAVLVHDADHRKAAVRKRGAVLSDVVRKGVVVVRVIDVVPARTHRRVDGDRWVRHDSISMQSSTALTKMETTN